MKVITKVPKDFYEPWEGKESLPNGVIQKVLGRIGDLSQARGQRED